MRLFIAIELPETVKKQLAGVRSDIPGARWVPPGQLHLTLAFLGDISFETQAMLEKRLEVIALPAFLLQFEKTGCFPDRRRPRVLWVGIRPEPLLDDLACKVRQAVLACGIPQEDQPFSPHITLARIKSPGAPDVEQFLEHPVQNHIQPVEVREFTLFSSRLSAAGAVHAVVKKYSLPADDVIG